MSPSPPLRFAINGLGRIGRALLRIAHERPGLELAAINDLAPVEQLAHLVARDSVHGPFGVAVAAGDGALRVGDRRVRVFRRGEGEAVPWEEAGVAVVVEATGRAETHAAAARHLRPGVGHVVVSANAADADVTVCLGVNEDRLEPRHRVISNASCTTNCMAPVALVLHRSFGLRRGLLTTVHSYTRGQELLDAAHPDPRRARAAALNLVPASTGAAQAVGLVLPELAGRLDAQAVRVPVPNVSLVQFVVELERRAGREDLVEAFRAAAAGPLSGILGVSDEPLVSADFVGDARSAVVDLPLLQTLDDELWRVVAWYDNEWGYAHRLADLIARLGGSPR